MAMKQCPKCGEEYSDTYKECPFCEEEEALRSGKPSRRGRRSVQRSRQFSLITPTLIVLILIMLGLLIYLLYGDQLLRPTQPEEPTPPPVEETLPPVGEEPDQEPEESEEPTEGEEEEPSVNMPDATEPKPEEKPEEKPQPEKPEEKPQPEKTEQKPQASGGYEKAMALPDGLSLSSKDFTVKIAEESNQLKVSGGSGSYQWFSEDPKVASVDNQGVVTAHSRGTVNIVVSDGQKKGVCIVRSSVNKTAEQGTTPASKPTSAKLNKSDYTTRVGEPDVQLKVEGAGGNVSWSSADSSVATVSANGLVKAVGKGHTTITASFDGSSLSCIVRVA